MAVPILIFGDAPTAPTGLGRIARDLAIRINEELPTVFRVGTCGHGAASSRHLGFPQYTIKVGPDYVPHELPRIWDDFAGDEKGIILTIWNASWLWWLADCGKLPDGWLKNFLRTKPFQRWGYIPVDGHCTEKKLPNSLGEIISGFNRVLAYTEYGAEVIANTWSAMDGPETKWSGIDHLPHGLDTSVFYPRSREEARERFVQKILDMPPAVIDPETFLMGVVATNSPRKDWYLAFETCAELLKRGVPVGLWAHTDVFKKHWDLPALAEEFGMKNRVMWSNHMLSDDDLAWGYSACDVTLVIGSGEGFGYPCFESLACGVPVIHGDYAGAAEFVPKDMLVKPLIFRGDGMYGIRRPVFIPNTWADAAKFDGTWDRMSVRESLLPECIDWNNAWPEWEKWLRAGVK